MSSSFPQLSIVVAVFNGEKFLPQFFNCLHAQQLENWELILVDDGSTDNLLLQRGNTLLFLILMM